MRVLLVVALLVVILLQRIRAGKAISLELQKHVRLYSITNDSFFEYDFKKKRLILKDANGVNGNGGEIVRYDLSRFLGKDSPEGKSQRLFLEILDSPRTMYRRYMSIAGMESGTGSASRWRPFATVRVIPVYAIGKISVIDEEKSEKESLREQAQRDSMTHLYNSETSKRLIEEHLPKLQPGEVGALLLLDVDLFKSINDTYGHMCGDETLKAVARLLESSFRDGDVIGRPGGDEFLVYLPRIQDIPALTKKCARPCVRQCTKSGWMRRGWSPSAWG